MFLLGIIATVSLFWLLATADWFGAVRSWQQTVTNY